MKTKRFVKLMQLLLAAVLTVCLLCAVGISSSATAENSLEVGGSNLEYSKYTHLIVTLDGTVQDGYTKGIAVWAPDVTGELSADNASFTNFTADYDSKGVEYYATQGIPASEMGKEYSIAPAVKDAEGNVTLAGEIVKRSITGYVMERLGDENLQSYQVDLYRKLIAYGTASEAVLDGGAQTTVVVTKGGYVGEQNFPLAIVEGETALIRASVQNAEGKYFSHWADSKGNLLTGERVATVDVKKGINTFTAVYGDKADSAYGYFADFQSFETGKYNFVINTSSLTDAQKTAGVVGRYLPLFKSCSSGADIGIKSTIKFDNSDTTLEALPITEEDTLTIKENLDGIKYLNYNHSVAVGSEDYQTLINHEGDATLQYTYERFEMDFNIASSSTNAATTIQLKFHRDGNGYAGFQFALGKFVDDNDNEFLRIHYYPTDVAYRIIDIPVNEAKRIFTIGADIDESGNANIYIDGVKLELEGTYKTYTGTLQAGTWHPAIVQIAIPTNVTFDYNIYSYGLVDTDLTK
ncbi:MAG: hypothetical protein IJX92_02525 [Clostridia bacterium]|nr:hypothetical protein [Clostridia bacterium]